MMGGEYASIGTSLPLSPHGGRSMVFLVKDAAVEGEGGELARLRDDVEGAAVTARAAADRAGELSGPFRRAGGFVEGAHVAGGVARNHEGIDEQRVSVGLALGGLFPRDAAGFQVDRVEVAVVGADVGAIFVGDGAVGVVVEVSEPSLAAGGEIERDEAVFGIGSVVRFARGGDEHDLADDERRVRVALNADAGLPEE